MAAGVYNLLNHKYLRLSEQRFGLFLEDVLEVVWILPLISLRRYFSVYLGSFLASLPSPFLQIDHYLSLMRIGCTR